ncbi:MAG: nucleoside triphosphate pyrophosphohydrolase [Candidatus Taylorbacteria bacterium]|nr:nucleoside triphosphate pyrophosphohydrolase [Candidatus Taylorbacteria bacterium]
MKYNKLVRDNIPEIISAKGGKVVAHIAEETEYWEKLNEKLLEEVKEFLKEPSVEEMADIQEVLEAIADFKQFTKAEITEAKKQKADKRGRFEKRIILDES